MYRDRTTPTHAGGIVGSLVQRPKLDPETRAQVLSPARQQVRVT